MGIQVWIWPVSIPNPIFPIHNLIKRQIALLKRKMLTLQNKVEDLCLQTSDRCSQETMMDNALRTISYIADIGSVVVLMARRRLSNSSSLDCTESDLSTESQKQYRMMCYVFESEDVRLIFIFFWGEKLKCVFFSFSVDMTLFVQLQIFTSLLLTHFNLTVKNCIMNLSSYQCWMVPSYN